MSCLSRLLGLVCAIVPGLGLLIFSVLMVQRWPDLGLAKGLLYSLMCAITGAVCLYLGLAMLFGRNRREVAPAVAPELERPTPIVPAPEISAAPTTPLVTPSIFAEPSQTALTETTTLDTATLETAPSQLAPRAPIASADTPEARIRRLASTRPGWQITAPQLAQLANLGLSVTDATARHMAQSGQGVAILSGPNGEVVYQFDVSDHSNADNKS